MSDEILYKYYSDTSEFALNNLKKKVIVFTPLENLNDPWEGYGHYSIPQSEEEIEYWHSINAPDISKHVEQHLIDDYCEALDFKYRVFCTSHSYSNKCMWIHYANSYCGFCVGYRKADIETIADIIEDIVYADSPCQLDSLDKHSLYRVLLYKSKDWAYEKECRSIYELKDDDVQHRNAECFHCSQPSDEIRTLNLNHFETLCAKKYIEKECSPVIIYLGMMISQELRNELTDIAKQLNIPIKNMVRCYNSFDVEFHPK